MVALVFILIACFIVYAGYICYQDIKDMVDEQKLPKYIKTEERRK